MDKYRLVLDVPFPNKSIISYGLVIYAKNTGRWAIIQRKHTIEFLLIIKGFFRLTYLPFFLSKIMPEESIILNTLLSNDKSYFMDFYVNKLQLPQEDFNYSLMRLNQSKKYIIKILEKLDLSKNKLSWSWPKGRLQFSSVKEIPFECAKRESIEELEIILPDPIFVSNNFLADNVKTITGKNIESRYWLYVIPHEIPVNQTTSHLEVSDRKWVDTNTCKSLINSNIFDTFIHMLSTI
jgi:hypothetical protein